MKRTTTSKTKKPEAKEPKLQLIKEITKELTKVRGGCQAFCGLAGCCMTRE